MSKSIEQNTISQKVLIKWGLIYGFILALINFGGFIIVITSKLPTEETVAIAKWNAFRQEHVAFIGSVMGIIFIIPFLILAFYLFKKNDETLPGRIINLPIAYALFGSLGWLLPYIFELVCLFYIRIHYGIGMHSVAVFSFFNVLESALFIGTFAYIVLYGVHRHYVLPKYFPEGHLNQYKGTKQLHVRVLISYFYLSVGVIPIIYLVSVLYNFSYNLNFSVGPIIYETAFGFIVIGFVMLFFFSKSFTHPLDALRDATDSIKKEKYEERVKVVCCDEFGELADNFNDMASELDAKSKRIFAMQDATIKGMAVMVESRDNSTGGHIYRTSDCVRILVSELIKEGFDTDRSVFYWYNVIKSAPMHDLGKIAVDDAILRKPGKYTAEEYEKMKAHTKEGARIVETVLKDVDDSIFKTIAVNVAHYHHEKWDGTGYPEGISKKDIPLEARIMALADVFDALVSKRCYKEKMTFDEAFKIIEESLGSHFDPELGAVFMRCRPQLEELYISVEE